MTELRVATQGGWALVDGNGPETGVWTMGLTACEAVYVSCPSLQRVAMCHLDLESRLDQIERVIFWATKGVKSFTIFLNNRGDLDQSEYLRDYRHCISYVPRDYACGMLCDGEYVSEPYARLRDEYPSHDNDNRFPGGYICYISGRGYIADDNALPLPPPALPIREGHHHMGNLSLSPPSVGTPPLPPPRGDLPPALPIREGHHML